MSQRLLIIVGAVAIGGAYWVYEWFGTASISVTSEPAGAVVRIDGRQRGVTPINDVEVGAGNHRLEVQHSHYAAAVKGLSLRRGDHISEHFELALGSGRLELLSNPRGAWIEVDGERLEALTPTTIEVTSGLHQIAMGQAERQIVAQEQVVNDGQTLTVNYNLNINPHGSLALQLQPRGAKVTFLESQDLQYERGMRLPIGRYRLQVEAPGFATLVQELVVEYGDNTPRIALQRLFGELKLSVTPRDAQLSVSYRDGGKVHNSPYQPDVHLPVGTVEVTARAIGYRTAQRRVDLTASGAALDLALTTMNVSPGSVFRDALGDSGEGPELVIVPGGQFVMGREAGLPSERPARQVTITQPFAVSRYEISVAEFLPFSRATGAVMDDRIDPQQGDYPITRISHRQALDYAAWLSEQTGERYRLLSEAEWEYVARAGSQSQFFFGNDPQQLCTYGNVADQAARELYRGWETVDCDDGQVKPGPIGRYQANPFGVYDLYGNVSEWIADCDITDYAEAPSDGSAVVLPSCDSFGFRGGSWDSNANEANSTSRNSSSRASDDRGIRLLRVL